MKRTPGVVLLADLSHHNGEVDFEKMKADGIDGVICKASDGASYKDATFVANIKGARDEGLLTFAYHFYRPLNRLEDQIRNFLSQVALVGGPLGYALDVEPSPHSVSGVDEWTMLTPQKVQEAVDGWMEAVQDKMRVIGFIYTDAPFANEHLQSVALGYYHLWLARYIKILPKAWQNYIMWQFTKKAVIDGVEFPCDLNRFEGTVEELSAYMAVDFKS